MKEHFLKFLCIFFSSDCTTFTAACNYNLLPENTPEHILARRIYEFNRYLKAICKFNSSYYVLSQNAIYQFNKEGKFVKSLDKRGGGPEEYSSIFDFDVISYNGEDELWISVPGLIRIYDVDLKNGRLTELVRQCITEWILN